MRAIVSNSPGEIVTDVDVAADAQPGKRDVVLQGSSSVLAGAIAVYDRIDYLRVTPESAMAAFGDAKHPRGFQQFEAIGYQRGPDGRCIRPTMWIWGRWMSRGRCRCFMHATIAAGFRGEDKSFRSFVALNLNPNSNFDTWAIATARDDKGADGEPLVGKAYVVVTIPTYVFNGRQYVRDLDRWVDDGPALIEGD